MMGLTALVPLELLAEPALLKVLAETAPLEVLVATALLRCRAKRWQRRC